MDLCYYRKTKTKALGIWAFQITCSTLVRNNTSSGTSFFTGIFFSFNMLDSNNSIWFMTICIIHCKTCYCAEEPQLALACLCPHAYTHPFFNIPCSRTLPFSATHSLQLSEYLFSSPHSSRMSKLRPLPQQTTLHVSKEEMTDGLPSEKLKLNSSFSYKTRQSLISPITFVAVSPFQLQ